MSGRRTFGSRACHVSGRVVAHRLHVSIRPAPRIVASRIGRGHRNGGRIYGRRFQCSVVAVEFIRICVYGSGEDRRGFFFREVFGLGEDEFQIAEAFFHTKGGQADSLNLFHTYFFY